MHAPFWFAMVGTLIFYLFLSIFIRCNDVHAVIWRQTARSSSGISSSMTRLLMMNVWRSIVFLPM